TKKNQSEKYKKTQHIVLCLSAPRLKDENEIVAVGRRARSEHAGGRLLHPQKRVKGEALFQLVLVPVGQRAFNEVKLKRKRATHPPINQSNQKNITSNRKTKKSMAH